MRKFSDKRDEKEARKKTYRLKLEFYNTDKKMKNIIRLIFISMIMHPNFMHFRQKISFKCALEIFTPVNGYLRTASRKYVQVKCFKKFYVKHRAEFQERVFWQKGIGTPTTRFVDYVSQWNRLFLEGIDMQCKYLYPMQ